MAKNLVIVESPAKAKTIKKFLGTGYEVIASNGHVRDLPKSSMGIDVENDFEPKYITLLDSLFLFLFLILFRFLIFQSFYILYLKNPF